MTKTWAEIIEEGMAKAGFTRSECSVKNVIEAACTRPNIKKLMMQEGAQSAFTQRMALFFHLMGDQVDAKIVNNFIKAFDEKLIVTSESGTVRDYIADFLLSFKGQPPLLGSEDRIKHLVSLNDEGKASIKAALEEGGSIWKIDQAVTTMPLGSIRRGLVAETNIYYSEKWGWGWVRDSTETGIDWWKGLQAEQLKTVAVDSPTTRRIVKGALGKMLQPGRAKGCKEFCLDIRKKPGLDTSIMQQELDALKNSDAFKALLMEGESVSFTISEYAFP